MTSEVVVQANCAIRDLRAGPCLAFEVHLRAVRRHGSKHPSRASIRGNAARVWPTSGSNLGSLNSSVRTTGTITSCLSLRAWSNTSVSWPRSPCRKAIHVLVSAAIIGPSSSPRLCAKIGLDLDTFAAAHRSAEAAKSCRPGANGLRHAATLARCALSRSSTGTSTVILRAAPMHENTIPIPAHEICHGPRAAPASTVRLIQRGFARSGRHNTAPTITNRPAIGRAMTKVIVTRTGRNTTTSALPSRMPQ